jgi:hypothetical protein
VEGLSTEGGRSGALGITDSEPMAAAVSQLQGQVGMVTGASSGLGRATALGLAAPAPMSYCSPGANQTSIPSGNRWKSEERWVRAFPAVQYFANVAGLL